MSRYLEFKTANEEIEALERWQNQPSGPDDDRVINGLLAPLVGARIAALKALFDEPTPAPVEPVKAKAAKGAVDAAVLRQIGNLAELRLRTDEFDWREWAVTNKLNPKSVLGAVRRHTEKTKA